MPASQRRSGDREFDRRFGFLYWEQQNRSHGMLRAFADLSLAGALREAEGLKSLFLFRLKAPMNRRDE
ncbi:hypothetical protein ACK9YZ_02395 [Rhizobium sp. ZK1]|uniref:hypothetical protein n=1 Tax=Rhizobium sp. ZK1 TaxID=3389872 RepID=UPI0039F69AB4